MAQGPRQITMPVGVVLTRRPGATRWAKWSWQATALLPGAGPASFAILREEGGATEYHAATLPLTLHAADAEAYRAELTARAPSVYVVMRERLGAEPPLEVALITASPYEGQDYADSGEEIVEKVPMTEGLIAWVRDWALAHHEETPFVKRKRDKHRIDRVQDGIGDARIRQASDIYRAPRTGAHRRAS